MFTLYCTTCAFVTCLLIKGVQYSWNSTGPTPTLGMRLSCKFVNVYTIGYRVQYTSFTRVHARISNGHPPEDPREENRACRTSRRTSRRGSSCVSGSDKRAALPQLTASYSCDKLNGRHKQTFSRRSSRRCQCPCRCLSRGIPACVRERE